MDKTFRVLLIASIVIAISMGLSAFKKSKTKDVVVKEPSSLVDKHSESKDVLSIDDKKSSDKSGDESNNSGSLEKKHNADLSNGAGENHDESHDVSMLDEHNKDNSEQELDLSDKHDKKIDDTIDTDKDKGNLAYNSENVVNDNKVDDNSLSSDSSSKSEISDSLDEGHSKEDNASIDAKSELVPIG